MTKNPVRIDFSKSFDKQLRKAPVKIKIAFRKRLSLFLRYQHHPLLNNHSLIGKLTGLRSINITGDWRAIYSIEMKKNKEYTVLFEMLGTHSQLYK
ncbi:MAG: hypothetical protein UW52_C0069G0003 [Candidatus Gottesmanbacteria bacterium GW2011_GWA1_44_24b]|uniref:Plasmid stabilization system n=1 Tax=Candidatus Gottesmanbacteria bacterium GW2011_GWA1_44_24b TaxID=1618437 RepID=A0A0G1ID30_9BACT|nr:MAG: hypothetical protein UW52_C0069G0003 [Candidatus Gottesmanbacteria bacterium GW2011_GWA1_44_24b]HCM82742.1 hypothetical protein [Patescibacteria group bacterium]